jgi:hypothetical protein
MDEGSAAMGNHVSRDDLPAERMGDWEGRTAELEQYTVTFERIPAGFPPGGDEAFRGLPDDACQCPHWGYLFRGAFKLSYTDGHEEIVRSGQAYYAAPGHRFLAIEECETVEFSPTEELQQVQAVVGANVEAAMAGKNQVG